MRRVGSAIRTVVGSYKYEVNWHRKCIFIVLVSSTLKAAIHASVSLSEPPSGIQAAANEVPGRPYIDAQHKQQEKQQHLLIARLNRAPTPREK